MSADYPGLRSKMTWRLIVPLAALSFLNSIDRVNVSYAAVKMMPDVGLTPLTYGFGISSFFIAYLIFQYPHAALLNKIGARRWLFGTVFAWGVIGAGMAFIDDATAFYVMRLDFEPGPRLTGRAVPYSGGDWPLIWPNGVIEFNAHYLLEASDGTPTYVRNRGFAHAPPDVQARLNRGEPVDPAQNYCRLAPRFETPPGVHDWMTRTVFVGYGEKHAVHTFFDYYAVL